MSETPTPPTLEQRAEQLCEQIEVRVINGGSRFEWMQRLILSALTDARDEGRRETKDELLLGNTGMGNSDDPPSTSGERHELGPWKVIRTGGITVAQGYECSCGVIGCAQGS
jgi:hypothetical protein